MLLLYSGLAQACLEQPESCSALYAPLDQQLTVIVTLHDKTKHIALTTDFKATITNYDLWTTGPANLKSLAPVGSEIWAKMYQDHL